jgi:hypothetical protein
MFLRENLPSFLDWRTLLVALTCDKFCPFVHTTLLSGCLHALIDSDVLRRREPHDAAIKKADATPKSDCYGPARFCGDSMPQPEAQAHVLEEWFRLPESRRMHATDAVAFAFRLLQDRPEMVARLPIHNDAANHDIIVSWLLPYLNKQSEMNARW